MAIYAIGDIHGSLSALKTIFKKGNINSDDTVVFLGDFVDKGPNSKGVLDWLIQNQKHYDFHFLKGNHEIMMLNARSSLERLREWLNYGGTNTLDSYEIGDDFEWMNKIEQSHWDFLESCKPYLKISPFIFVHAGLERGKDLSSQDEFHLCWKKYQTPEKYKSSKTVICGHTARKKGEIADFGHTICIDTFAHGGQWLTCLNVETLEYVQANNKAEVQQGKLRPG